MKDQFEKAKYLVTRNILYFTSFALLALAVVNFITKDTNFIRILIGCCISFSALFTLLKTKKYFFPSIVAVCLGYALNITNLFVESAFENYVDLFWMLNLSLLCFFTLSKRFGIYYLYFNILSLVIITILTSSGVVQKVSAQELSTALYINFSLNIINLFHTNSYKAS